MRSRRRDSLRYVTAGLICVVSGCTRPLSEEGLSRARPEHEVKDAKDREQLEVERLYSTKPVRIRTREREYVVPVNFFTPAGAQFEAFKELPNGFGFVTFLPDYSGFTTENWRKGWFDKRRIEVISLKPVDKVVFERGQAIALDPASYGDPKAQFVNRRAILEDTPSLRAFDLDGYRFVSGEPGICWTGTRSDGEFFFFDSTSAPDEHRAGAAVYSVCTVRYYNASRDLFISYIYSQDHLAKWREIDDALWAKVHSWRVI